MRSALSTVKSGAGSARCIWHAWLGTIFVAFSASVFSCATAVSGDGGDDVSTATSSNKVVDARGPSGMRRNYWWWLALGVSGFLILLLILLLVLSWYCHTRRRRRRRTVDDVHHGDAAKEQGRRANECGGGQGTLSDGAFSTSPDNFPTRNGSKDSEERVSRDEAAVTVSTYVNTAHNQGPLSYAADGASQGEDAREGKRRIFLAGGKKAKSPNEKQKKSRGKKGSLPPHSSHPQHHAAAPAEDAPAASWTNKPRGTTAAPQPPLPSQAAASRRSPVVERLPPVHRSIEADVLAANPLCPPAAQRPDRKEDVVTGSVEMVAGTPLPQSLANEVIEVAVGGAAPSQPRNPSVERVVDVPIVPVEPMTAQEGQTPAATDAQGAVRQDPVNAEPPPQRQRQLARSPMRPSVVVRDVRTSEISPAAEAAPGPSKQYYFGYQRKPAAATAKRSPPPRHGEAEAAESLSHTPQTKTLLSPLLSPSSSPPPPPLPVEGAPGQPVRTPAPLADRPEQSPSPQRRTPPTAHATPNAARSSPRPASASLFSSQAFNPLRLSGMEAEASRIAAGRAAEAAPSPAAQEAVVAAAAPIVVAAADRPPRHEHPSPHPRAPVTQQTAGAPATAGTSLPPPLHPTSSTATPTVAPRTSSATAKRRIELFRKDSGKKRSNSPPPSQQQQHQTRGRLGSAPATGTGGRPPLPLTATQSSAVGSGGSAAHRRPPSTVTKGVPQLFFGKRDSSPVRQPSPGARAASAHQRPPRPGSGQGRGDSASRRGFNPSSGRGGLQLSAAQLSQPSAAALLPTSGATLSASAAAALVGGGATNAATAGSRFGSSLHNSPSHYGSASSSLNGGNSPSRTSLGRMRSSSRVKFVDGDGNVTAAEAPASAAASVPAAKAAGEQERAGGRDGAAAHATAGSRPSALTTSPRGSGAALKGRPHSASGAIAGLAAPREPTPQLPPVPASAQVVVEQGRRTVAPVSAAGAAEAVMPPPQRTTSPARRRDKAPPLPQRRAHSPETATPPFSTATEAPLEVPQLQALRGAVPAVLTPTSASHRTDPHVAASLPSPPLQPANARSPPSPTLSPNPRLRPPRTRRDLSPSRATTDVQSSLSSDASTVPAGMLANAKGRDRRGSGGTTAAAANAATAAAPAVQPPAQSPPPQPLLSSVSPYGSARRIQPSATGVAASQTATPPSRISVLRITQMSGEVQLRPPPMSSQHSRGGVGAGEDDDMHVVNSYSRFASGNLAPAATAGEPSPAGGGSAGASSHYASGTRRGLSAHYGSHRSDAGARPSLGSGRAGQMEAAGQRYGSATSHSRRAPR